MKKIFATIFAATILLSGCGENSQARDVEKISDKKISGAENFQATGTGEKKILTAIKISVGEKNFSVTLEDNPTARAFAEKLPLAVDMTELNGNEKFFYLDDDLPNAPSRVGQIHAGDVMLFGANCVVIFYKDFATSYSYTRLGKFDDVDGLEKIFGDDDVRVTFAK